jgi:hypothetical protein
VVLSSASGSRMLLKDAAKLLITSTSNQTHSPCSWYQTRNSPIPVVFLLIYVTYLSLPVVQVTSKLPGSKWCLTPPFSDQLFCSLYRIVRNDISLPLMPFWCPYCYFMPTWWSLKPWRLGLHIAKMPPIVFFIVPITSGFNSSYQ